MYCAVAAFADDAPGVLRVALVVDPEAFRGQLLFFPVSGEAVPLLAWLDFQSARVAHATVLLAALKFRFPAAIEQFHPAQRN